MRELLRKSPRHWPQNSMSAVLDTLSPPVPARRQKSAYDSLPRRHRRFVDHVVTGISGAEAIRLAGCRSHHGRNIAARWMRRPEIRAALEEREAQLVHDAGVRQHLIVQQMQAVAMSDPRKLVDEKGVPIPLQTLDPMTAAAISSIEIEQVSSDGETGTRYKYKFWDKVKANDRLGQWLKLWDASRATVNVDARSVTVNAGDSAVAAAALQSVLRFGQQLAEGRPAIGVEASGADGSVLPAALLVESNGRGASLAVEPDAGRSEEP